MNDTWIAVVVMFILAVVFGLLSHPAAGQDHPMPPGVTYKDGKYYVKQHVLKQFKRSQIRAYRELAQEYKIKYVIIK